MFTVFGPGIVVMLADTDAGSIITGAQSGVVWGYKLILLQLILIPVLFITQELTVRLGVTTGLGHGELIQKHFGKFWACFSVSTLMICCFGAIITQFAGLASVGALFGIPCRLSLSVIIAFLLIIVLTGTYRSVERCAIAIGLFELVFVGVMFATHPSCKDIINCLFNLPITNSSYLYLAAANIGAVIMPWMIFYQQSAIVDKGLKPEYIKPARWDTAIGAVITQTIMIAVIITTASTIGRAHPGKSLQTVHQISDALIPFLGATWGRILFALGMIGASLVATIVVSLTAAWGLGEVTGYKHSLEHKPKEAPWFYGIYIAIIIFGGIIVVSGINLVNLSVAIEVLNAVLLPIVLGFLYLLAVKVLPEKYRLKGFYAVIVGIILAITSLFGCIAGIWGWFAAF